MITYYHDVLQAAQSCVLVGFYIGFSAFRFFGAVSWFRSCLFRYPIIFGQQASKTRKPKPQTISLKL